MVEGWVDVGASQDVTSPPWPVRDVEGTSVRLVRDGDGTIHAVEPTCPHLGSPLTSAPVDNGVLECPFHWYAFALDSGENLHPGYDDCTLLQFPTRVQDGRIYVRPVSDA